MATATFQNPSFVKNRLGGVEPYARGGSMESYFGEAASQTYAVGALLYIDSSGDLAVVTKSTDTVSSAIAGVAKKAATGTQYTVAEFAPIHPDDVWAMNTYHSTAASSVPTRAMLGNVYSIIHHTTNTSGKYAVDVETAVEGSNNSLARVKIIGFADQIIDSSSGKLVSQNIPSSTVTGDIYGRVLVRFLENSVATTGTLAGKRILQL